MTAWTDSSLMAFADGELGAEQSTQLQAALLRDNALQARLVAITQQRERLIAAFAPVLAEPIPDRLSQLLRAPGAAAPQQPSPNVVDLGAARTQKEQRDAEQALRAAAPRPALPTWAQWGGMAASVVLGVLMGTQLQPTADGADIGLQGGKLLAGGAIEKSLSTQLASDTPSPQGSGTAVAVQLSFVDKQGQYCRTFRTGPLAGLACREQGRWAVQHLTTAEAIPNAPNLSNPSSAPTPEMRQASNALPSALLDAVDQRIAGDALNADAERAARAQGWQR